MQSDGAAQRLKGGRESRFYAHMIHFMGVVLDAILRKRSKMGAVRPGARSSNGALNTAKMTAMELLQQTRPRATMSMK